MKFAGVVAVVVDQFGTQFRQNPSAGSAAAARQSRHYKLKMAFFNYPHVFYRVKRRSCPWRLKFLQQVDQL